MFYCWHCFVGVMNRNLRLIVLSLLQCACNADIVDIKYHMVENWKCHLDGMKVVQGGSGGGVIARAKTGPVCPVKTSHVPSFVRCHADTELGHGPWLPTTAAPLGHGPRPMLKLVPDPVSATTRPLEETLLDPPGMKTSMETLSALCGGTTWESDPSSGARDLFPSPLYKHTPRSTVTCVCQYWRSVKYCIDFIDKADRHIDIHTYRHTYS